MRLRHHLAAMTLLAAAALPGWAHAQGGQTSGAPSPNGQVPGGQGNAIAVSTRPDITDTVYAAFIPGAKATLILLPGGNGSVPRVRVNFLIRIAPDLQRLGFSTVIVDAPSDHPDGINIPFRLSEEHMRDIAAIVAYAPSVSPAPVWLVGTSNGTVSAAQAATRMNHDIAGVVLTSSVWAHGLGIVPLQEIKVPVLVVHNHDDGCTASPPSGVDTFAPRFTGAPAHDVIWFSGGLSKGDACGALSPHGYLGIEADVVSQIGDWIEKH